MPVLEYLGSAPLPLFGVLPAYGPAPGVELIPYFLGMLAWVGLALFAVVSRPIIALIRRIRGAPGSAPGAVAPASAKDPQNAPPPEDRSSVSGSADTPYANEE